jgi:PTH1 family peptidyl-tRNA hydrolase
MTKKAMSRSVKAVVGLGNPGARYAQTRHNVGFWVVDALGKDMSWHAFEFCTWCRFSDDLVLVKPLTYMNKSGWGVAEVVRCFRVVRADVLVVVDDVHLNLGRLRFRRTGSHGGHNGLRSVESALGSADFPRLRLGVGQPAELDGMIDYVLGAFSPGDRDVIADAVGRAVHGALCWATEGIERAMNQYNKK